MENLKVASLAPVEFVIIDKDSNELLHRFTVDPNIHQTLLSLITFVIEEYGFDYRKHDLYKLNLI